MKDQLIKSISSYKNLATRNKIIFHFDEINEINEINSVDLGRKMAEVIFLKGTDRISLWFSDELDKILQNSIFEHPYFGNYLSVKNIGLILEPEIKFNFKEFLNRYSQNNMLLVKWEGEIDDGKLYFLTKENGLQINIKDLSHIVL